MVTAIGVAAAFILSFLSTVIAVPSPQSLESELTIVTHNDLYGASSARHAAAIVLGIHKPYSIASSNCAALGETLWKLENGAQDLSLLRYLEYDKTPDDGGEYWIGSGGGSGCRTINTHGEIRNLSCASHLPALCSQSASYSTPSSVGSSSKWQTSVMTGNATISGYRDKLSFRFLGLKYGSIPARFEYSKYAPPVGDNISALSYGPSCVQSGCEDPTALCSEACLYLNIWTPHLPNGQSARGKNKAVMLWIHGGGFTGGQGSDATFDGGNLASRGDVVVVTINYRLSTLGFLALDNSTLRGNYGIADQITALEWVQNHIEDFGGDKNRITVFGQSAGAASVRVLLASPQAQGKFSAAIMQSNPAGVQYASTFSQYLTISEATAMTKGILSETGCIQIDKAAQLACLRAQDPLTLVGRRNGTWTGTVARYPVIDGTYLTSDRLPLNASAATNVALMTGIMRDDGSPFSSFSKSRNASRALTEQGFDAADITNSNLFPLPQTGNATIDIFNLTSRVTTDGEFRCLGQSTAVTGSENDVFSAVYSYEFERAYQIIEWSPNPPTCQAPHTPERPNGDTRLPYFRCHSGDLYYVFGTLVRQGRPLRDEDDIPFSQYIVDTWAAFAREKDPNPDLEFLDLRGYSNTSAMVRNNNPWQPVAADEPTLRILDTTVRNENLKELRQCAVLNLPLDYYAR